MPDQLRQKGSFTTTLMNQAAEDATPDLDRVGGVLAEAFGLPAALAKPDVRREAWAPARPPRQPRPGTSVVQGVHRCALGRCSGDVAVPGGPGRQGRAAQLQPGSVVCQRVCLAERLLLCKLLVVA